MCIRLNSFCSKLNLLKRKPFTLSSLSNGNTHFSTRLIMSGSFGRAFRLVVPILAFVVSSNFAANTEADSALVNRFNKIYDAGDYAGVIRLGEKLTAQVPDDDIVLSKLAHAYYRFGEFAKVIGIAEKCHSIGLLPFIGKMDDLGFYTYAYAIWKMKVLSLAAIRKIDDALETSAECGHFQDASMEFVQYLLFLWKGNRPKADSIVNRCFTEGLDNLNNRDLYTYRLIPAIKNPSSLPDYCASVTSLNEYVLLNSCIGFTLFLRGKTTEGQQLLEKGLQNDNAVSESSIPVMLFSIVLNDDIKVRSALKLSAENPRWTGYSRLDAEFIETYYNNSDYSASIAIVDKMISLIPEDRDNTLTKAMLLMVEQRWSDAEKTIEDLLKYNLWNSENVSCARLYLPMLYLIRNKILQAREAIERFQKFHLPDQWQLIASVESDPLRYTEVRKKIEDKPNYLCVLLTIKALQAELAGEYTSAQDYYNEIVRSETMGRYLEYVLAEKRLQVIAPMAAIEGMK
jgi:tetratricopeptide (TPR) repeat protein